MVPGTHLWYPLGVVEKVSNYFLTFSSVRHGGVSSVLPDAFVFVFLVCGTRRNKQNKKIRKNQEPEKQTEIFYYY